MQVPVTLVRSGNLLGVQVGPETSYYDEPTFRQLLRQDPSPQDIARAIARRLREDNVQPGTATFAEVKASVERDPLEV